MMETYNDAGITKGQNATVLVVEDDPDLLEIVVTQLESLGYTVFSTQNGESALKVVEGNQKIDLLLTDIILSGELNGRNVADALQKLSPALKVLYMSGYQVDNIINYGQHEDTKLLKKPFTMDELAREVIEVLNN